MQIVFLIEIFCSKYLEGRNEYVIEDHFDKIHREDAEDNIPKNE